MANEENYILRYKPQWEQLEAYIKIIDKKGYSNLTTQEIKTYLDLMKRVSHHLAYVKTHFPKSRLCGYLNDLSVRAHNHLYVVKKSNFKAIGTYVTNGFARRLVQNRGYILAAFLVFMAGMLVSMVMVAQNPDNAGFFLPTAYLQNQDFNISESSWQEEQFFFLSSYVMINNIGVAIKSFAFGATAGIMTLYVLAVNGALVGALTQLVIDSSGQIGHYLALLLPHGIIELFAIFIAGGAGLRVGLSLLMPGQFRRRDSFIKEAKESVMLMPGVIMMLVLAGLVEGFLTPARIPYEAKLIFAGATALLLLLYLALPRKA